MAQNTAKAQLTTQASASNTENTPIIVETRKLLQRMKEISEAIGQRAYEFFEQRGHVIGQDIDDWLHAECELLRPVRVEISEDDKVLKVRAEVPGFSAGDIQVSVEPLRIIISGKTETTEEETIVKNEIFRELALPAEVDPSKATASLKDGILQLSIEKALKAALVSVEVKAG